MSQLDPLAQLLSRRPKRLALLERIAAIKEKTNGEEYEVLFGLFLLIAEQLDYLHPERGSSYAAYT